MKHLGLAVAFILVAAASFYAGTLSSQLKGAQAEKANWEQNIAEIDDLIARQNQTMGVMMDTQIRIFHYAKPHDAPIYGCPECAEILRKAKADPNKVEPEDGSKILGLPGTKRAAPPANKPAEGSKPADPPKSDATAKPAAPEKPATPDKPATDIKK